jgi:hypothetical protein
VMEILAFYQNDLIGQKKLRTVFATSLTTRQSGFGITPRKPINGDLSRLFCSHIAELGLQQINVKTPLSGFGLAVCRVRHVAKRYWLRFTTFWMPIFTVVGTRVAELQSHAARPFDCLLYRLELKLWIRFKFADWALTPRLCSVSLSSALQLSSIYFENSFIPRNSSWQILLSPLLVKYS